MNARSETIARLRRQRPHSRLVQVVVLAALVFVVFSWSSGELRVLEAFESARWDRFAHFVHQEALPYPLRSDEPGTSVAAWAQDLWLTRGAQALWTTFALALIATALAASFGALFGFASSHRFITPDALLEGGRRPTRLARILCACLTRSMDLGLVLLRAIPEYVLAFIFLAIFGSSAWPAVLALALHNAGILGKLGGEIIENQRRAPVAALRGVGASRLQLALTALPALGLGRYLVFVFYRFETCVREASVLGMLGFVSLGYWIEDARSKHYYDEMLFFVSLGAVLVLLAEGTSIAVRRRLS